jgi:hypothetical protein
LLFVFLYFCVGAALAAGAVAVPVLRRTMLRVAARLEIQDSYALVLWIIGTTVAWPIGLYVFGTGKLVLANGEDEPVSSSSKTRSMPPARVIRMRSRTLISSRVLERADFIQGRSPPDKGDSSQPHLDR